MLTKRRTYLDVNYIIKKIIASFFFFYQEMAAKIKSKEFKQQRVFVNEKLIFIVIKKNI